jgi:endonuclease/exonuclease/phosphatase family metal-dependent hydrolase
LRAGGVDLGAVASHIAALDAAVVAVQEVDRLQRRSGRVDQVMEHAERPGWHGLFAATMIGPAGAMRPASPDGADDGGPPTVSAS